MDTEKDMNSLAAHKGLLLGMVFGTAVGAFFDRPVIGIALGAAIGYLYDAGYFKSKRPASTAEGDAASQSPSEDDVPR
ncbi:hypothetical protein [Pseudoxanthomonas beigongshangi]|uniref:hypothetical protein n=1 Tax=Pseudoxanthomonas beigongshangi TaxID=2782537 RepID=UPI00193BBDD2|nr:hypothetical protein [Pseudoxanthomonas beigongshangi]